MSKAEAKKNPSDEQQEFDNLRALEALLFASPDLMTLKDMEPFFAENTDLKPLLEELDKNYQNRGIQLVVRGSAWGFRTAPDLADRLNVTQTVTKPLTKASTETLAIVSYHQPVTRAEIEQIRGVSISKSTLDILLKENFIKPGKRREIPGRPMTWVTTPHFLDYFGLESLKDLPNLKELKESGLLNIEPPMLAELRQQELKLEQADAREGEEDSDNELTSEEDWDDFEETIETTKSEQENIEENKE